MSPPNAFPRPSVLLAVILASSVGRSAAAPAPDLPIVDLGYSLHQALAFNETGGYYNFSNVRFTDEPPTGENRFRPAQLPQGRSWAVTNGGPENIVCPQAAPAWGASSTIQVDLLVEALASGNKTLFRDVEEGVIVNATQPEASGSGEVAIAPGESEDCLFLDLVVPRSAWAQRNDPVAKKAPVVIELYGGGYVMGSKRNTASAAAMFGFAGGLVSRSTSSGDKDAIEPTIVVIPNYRLGLFGFLGGELVEPDGTPNTGLLDQRLAMEWVQKYIHLFGGDASRVTLIGESAGAGSIEFHITANGGLGGRPPFQQAIPQSPTFYPQPRNNPKPDLIVRQLFNLTNTKNLAELRALPSTELQDANKKIVAASPYGFFSFGPTVAGSYVPDLPGKLLLEGRYHRDISLLMGHNKDEQFLFSSPFIGNETSAFNQMVEQQFPQASHAIQKEIEQSLYPPIFSGAQGYVNEFGRAGKLYKDSQFICNNIFLASAQPARSYLYTFDVPPAFHGQDIGYTWAPFPATQSDALNATVAAALQEYILSFAASGVPVSKSAGVAVPKYGSGRRIVELSATGIHPAVLEEDPRCGFWQRAPYAN